MSKWKAVQILLCLCVFSQMISPASAGGKKRNQPGPVPRPAPEDGKRVIGFHPVQNVKIELADGRFHDFGMDFQSRLTTKLQESGRYLVADTKPATAQLRGLEEGPPGFVWSGSFVPAASLRFQVKAMSFVTGSRGERMFYGFDERVRSAFNDGTGTQGNEFPIKQDQFQPSWFDKAFDDRGESPFNSRSGLDIGDGLKLDFIIGWLAVKYARYRAQFNLALEIDAPIAGRMEKREIQVRGDGLFFDVAGGYEGYMGGLTLARNTAILKAFENAIDASYSAVERAIDILPLTALVDGVVQEGEDHWVLLGTGRRADVKPGTQYESTEGSPLVIEVSSSVASGSIARLVSGDLAKVTPGRVLRQRAPDAKPVIGALRALASSERVLTGVENIEMQSTNFPKPEFQRGTIPDIGMWEAFIRNLVETLALPYRIWRFFQYDRPYDAVPASAVATFEENVKAPDDMRTPDDEKPEVRETKWWVDSREQAWARQVHLSEVPAIPSGTAPVVAIIDSGVDYLHPVIHDSLWINPKPKTDWRGFTDVYGWDFISGDSRPYDDTYHGTQLASMVLAVSPNAKIMPLKVFNPWGVTNSASMLAAFQYAVENGAKIIVCGWASIRRSAAIQQGIEYAQKNGVLVVVAAGDVGSYLEEVKYYPVNLTPQFDNMVSVTAVDPADRLISRQGQLPNYGAAFVTIAAPGQDILVAEPRVRHRRQTSTGIAAGMVAGALARIMTLDPSGDYRKWAQKLKDDADVIPALSKGVEGSRRLRVRD